MPKDYQKYSNKLCNIYPNYIFIINYIFRQIPVPRILSMEVLYCQFLDCRRSLLNFLNQFLNYRMPSKSCPGLVYAILCQNDILFLCRLYGMDKIIYHQILDLLFYRILLFLQNSPACP